MATDTRAKAEHLIERIDHHLKKNLQGEEQLAMRELKGKLATWLAADEDPSLITDVETRERFDITQRMIDSY